MSNRDGEHTLICGKTGSGKSELAKRMVEKSRRVFVIDPKGSWLKYKGYEALTAKQIKPFLRDMGDGAFRAVYRPSFENGIKHLSQLGLMMMDYQHDYFYERSHEKLTVVADELAQTLPLGLPSGNFGFANLAQQGREYGINIVGITQSPSTIHTSIRQNINHLRCFNFSFKNDREAIGKIIEDQGAVDAVSSIEKYHYIKWTDGQNWEVAPPVPL